MATGPSFTVLCVDDQEDNRAGLAMILALEGYRALEARSGREAVALAPSADLVILDVGLPDMSGLAVCQRIKAAPDTALLPVILLSGHFTRSEDKAEGLEGGGDVYLVKPVDPRELLGQVKALLRIRQAELLLREQAQIIDQVHDAVIATDLEGRVTRWNGGAERISGYATEEVLGREVGLLDPAGAGVRFADLLPVVRDKGNYELEMRVRMKSGEVAHVHASLSRLHNGRGAVAGFVAYCTDITERKRLEEQYQQSQKMEAVGKLAGGIAHEFNNLLTVVTGFGHILAEALAQQDPQRGFVAEILKASDRAVVLTRQLLAYSRKAMVQPRPLDLNGAVRAHEEQLRARGTDRITVVADLAPALGDVSADPGQVAEAIAHLTANARDAMPTGGTLTLHTRAVVLEGLEHAGVRPGAYALLAVTDTGEGMTRDTLTHLFEPFFTTKDVGRGTGLGLASVYGFVKQAHGHIEVASEPGQGSTVSVYLPLTDGQNLATAPAPGADHAIARTVLLVQEDDAVRGLTRHILHGEGYRVLEAAHGSAAVEAALNHPGSLDLLVADVVMPGMSGVQLARRLVTLRPGLKTLFLSGYGQAVANHLTDAEREDLLEKPYTQEAFLRKLRMAMGESKAV